MKKINMNFKIKSIAALVVMVLLGLNLSAQVDRTHAPAADVPEDINLGDLKTITLDNGMEVFLVPKPGYGKFVFSMTIDQPTFVEESQPECRGALTNFFYTPSSKNYSYEEFDSIQTYAGAKVSIHMNGGHVIALRDDLDPLMEMFTDQLYNPSFDADELAEFVKTKKAKQAEEALEVNKAGYDRSNSALANQSLFMYIRDSLLHDKVEEVVKVVKDEDVDYDKVTLASVKAFHAKRIVASRTSGILMGDFTEREARKLLNKYFAQWDAGQPLEDALNIKSDAKFLDNRQIVVMEKPGSVQSSVSYHWNLGDVYAYGENAVAIEIMNQILGGYTKSYIYRNLREDKGLCYYALSSISGNTNGGTGFIKTDVRTDVTALAIENIIYEMLHIRNAEISDEDFRVAKNSLIGDYARSLSGTAVQRFLGFSMMKSDFNLSDDYLKTYPKEIGQVSKEEVKEMAIKYVKPNNCLICVEGDVEAIKAQNLEQYGSVTYLDKEGKVYKF